MKNNNDAIIERAEAKIQLSIDLINGDNELQNKLGWGPHIVYLFLQTEEYCEELVTFEDEEEAQEYLKHLLEKYCVDDDDKCWEEEYKEDIENGYTTAEESDINKKEVFEEFDRLSSWDLPMRKGQNKTWGYTVGYANATDFVDCLPEDKAKYFLESFFWSNLIPGFYEEH